MNNKSNEPLEEGLKDWTVMVYLGGDNNLSEECLWSIKEMYRIGLTKGYAVVAQYDSIAGGIFRYDLDDIKPVQVRGMASQQSIDERRYDIDGWLNDKLARAINGTDVSASISTLTRFVRDVVKKHPAKHYMLVLSGHAGGAVGRFLLSDGFPPGNFSIRELAIALVRIKEFFKDRGKDEQLDILGLDACAMSMAEVGYELKGLANYMVGAEGFEPASGWPYHRVLEVLQSDSSIEPEAFAKKIVEKYIDYYADFAVAGRSTDQTVCNLDNHEKLFRAIKRLAAVLDDRIEVRRVMDATILAHWRAQSYKFEEYVDLWDFCDLLANARVDEAVTIACESVRDAIYSAGSSKFKSCNYVVKSCFTGPEYQYSRGLSIYFPWVLDRRALRQYQRRLFFSIDTQWGKFIEKYVILTRRQPRGFEKQIRQGQRMVRFTPGVEAHRVSNPDDRLVEFSAFTDPDDHRITNPEDRVTNPRDRFNFDDRISNPDDRISNHLDRITNPEDRITNPEDRITNPEDRITSPEDRISNPEDRITSPKDRISNPKDRGELFEAKVKNPPITFIRHRCSED